MVCTPLTRAEILAIDPHWPKLPAVSIDCKKSEYLTLELASELTSTPIKTIRHWIECNRLPACKPGKRVLIKKSDLQKLLEESAVVNLRKTRARAKRL